MGIPFPPLGSSLRRRLRRRRRGNRASEKEGFGFLSLSLCGRKRERGGRERKEEEFCGAGGKRRKYRSRKGGLWN